MSRLVNPTDLDKVFVRKGMSSDFLQVILLLEAACHKLSLHPEDPATREIAVRTLLAFRVELPAGASAFLRGLASDIAKQAELLHFQLRVLEPDLHRLEATALRICVDLAELKKAAVAEATSG